MNTEAKVISAVCKNKDISVMMMENVDDLFISHKDVWDGLKRYWVKYKAVPDIQVLQERFGDFDYFEPQADTKFYLDQLRNDFIKSQIQNLFVDEAKKLNTLAATHVLQDTIAKLSTLNKFSQTVKDLDITDIDAAETHYRAQFEKSRMMGGSPGIPTGFTSIDAAYPTGMAPGHLIVIIGWPGRAKTWFSGYMACKAWEQGFTPMLVSLEMSPENMRDRLYTMMGSGLFRASEFSRGDVNIDDFKSWGRRNVTGKNKMIVISSEGNTNVTPSIVQAKAEQYRPDLIIADYHQLFDDDGHSRSEVERNRNISRQFKLLAINSGIPIIDITAATMEDISDQNTPPLLSQVAWSKAIEYDADMAMAVHKADNSDVIEVVCRKNRHGSQFSMFLDWDIDRGIIKEITA